MIRHLYITFFLLIFCLPAFGQINIQFVPDVYGRNISGLFNCKIINPYQRQTVILTITVTEKTRGTVCIIKTPEFTMLAGANPVPPIAAHGSSVQLANTKGNILGINNTFPEGSYTYCFNVDFVHSDNPPAEQCFDYDLAPFSQLNLINPYDQDKICDKKPLLTWQPLIPGVAGSFYQLVLAEIKSGQNATEALKYNQPIINQSGIMSPVLPYPAVAKELEEHKKYAWQVTAYKDQTIINRSDVWEFTVSCEEKPKTISSEGYRDIEDLLKGNFYIATGQLRFALVNAYQPQNLKYEIYSIINSDKKIKRLPKIKLGTGNNLINIPLADHSLQPGQYYILDVWLPDGSKKTLRFLYEDE